MKKTLTAATAIALSLTLAACGGDNGGGEQTSGGDAGGDVTLDLLVPTYSDNTKGL